MAVIKNLKYWRFYLLLFGFSKVTCIHIDIIYSGDWLDVSAKADFIPSTL